MKTYLTNHGTFITECRYGGVLMISEDKNRRAAIKGCLALLRRRVKGL